MLWKVIKDIAGFGNTAKNPIIEEHGRDFPEIRQVEGGAIVCFCAGSASDALVELTKGLLAPMSALASRIQLIDVNRREWQAELAETLTDPVWFAAAFFAVGQEITALRDGRAVNLWEAAGVPFVRFFGDLPAYFPDRHVGWYRNSINCYFHSSHVRYYRRWFREPALSVLLPPIMFDPISLDQVDVRQKARGKIVFPKNGNSPTQLLDYWRLSLPTFLARILESLAEESVGSDWLDRELCLDDRLIDAFASIGMDIAADRPVLGFLAAQLDDYVRRVKSTMIARSLLDLPVVIRGCNWDHLNFDGKRASYDPDSDMRRTLAVIDQAPALIDMSPNTQHAPHDRICRAVGRGTAFLTNRQAFLGARFQSPARFSFGFDPAEIRTCVEHYVSRPDEAVELGLEQANVLRQVFTEEAFVRILCTAVQTCSLSVAGRPAGTQDFVAFPPKVYR